MIVLDTHALAWVTTDDQRLGRKARTLIARNWADGKVAVPAIVFWEIGMLQLRRRLRLPSALRDWRQSLLDAGVIELPLDGSIALRSLELSGLPNDPADRFIVATALVHGAALMTADEKILSWRHGLERHDAQT